MTKVGEGLSRAALIARADKRAPLVIQLARYCPMILDHPPIHRFNAVEHVPRVGIPLPPFLLLPRTRGSLLFPPLLTDGDYDGIR